MNTTKPANISADSTNKLFEIDSIHFGTDGWRAIIGEDFNPRSVARVAEAAARAFRETAAGATYRLITEPVGCLVGIPEAGPVAGPVATSVATSVAAPVTEASCAPNTILIGYDCRLDAGRYAALAATVIASAGFDVLVSDRYCPTPALCWTIAHDPQIVGGLMLTSSHNPAEYLGIKLRMEDGGASPQAFTDKVEALMSIEPPSCLGEAIANFEAAVNGTPEAPAVQLEQASYLCFVDIMTAYIDALRSSVDARTIRDASLRVVVDPLFGAGRSYLVGLLREFGVKAVEVNGADDPSFCGLHPEPILPWVRVGAEKVVELGYDACFVTDGDADRIGAVDGTGVYVSSHRLLALLIGHLVEGHGRRGRVIRTRAGSNLLRRQCDRLDLSLVTCPIGFKWIYAEMLAGDVLIGGEESGGMGIPSHVRERDGLLMALLLVELMALKGKKLHQLVDELLTVLGLLEYNRCDLRLDPALKDRFLATHVNGAGVSFEQYRELFAALDEKLVEVERGDGIKFSCASDAWLLVRPSGTEPLVRVYAEAGSSEQVESLIALGCDMALMNIELPD